MGAEYCDEHVCLSCIRVSVREHISVTVRSTFTQFFDMLPIVTIAVTCYVLPYLLPLFGPFDGVAISYVFMVV